MNLNSTSITAFGDFQNSLILNNEYDNFYNELNRSLIGCKSFYINVAFVSYSGLQILLDLLKEAEEKGIPGKIITSTYLNFTDPKSLEKLLTFENIETKLFIAKPNLGFHPKGYIFEYDDKFKIIVGSSNITQSALKSNIEWNIAHIADKKSNFVTTTLKEFHQIWSKSEDITDEVLEQYKSFYKNQLSNPVSEQFTLGKRRIEPNIMQMEALETLLRLREHGEKKALAIAATGSGKTFMAAFDVRAVKPKRMLFIVHREEILLEARKSFALVIGDEPTKYGILSGNQKNIDSEYLFSTNISLLNNLDQFSPEHFDYIVIDEAHHVSSSSYQKALKHFRPKFLLGMTATPERGDAQSIYENFDNNIAVEIRLRDALDADLVAPFHYFGITEVGTVDYEGINLNDIDAIAKLLQTNRRVDHIIKNMDFYSFDGDICKAVGFCVSVEHAKYMSEEFNKRGIAACSLNSSNTREERQHAIKRLSCDKDPLEIIFTVDLFNEGVDIPAINLVLMLRPTASPIVFIQQLGRGLRKHQNKTFLTVLDFIGNHNKAFLMAIALCGSRFYDKDSLKVAVKKNFSSIPGCTHIRLDPISKEQILRQIEDENFNSMKYLKEEYINFKLALGNRIPTLMDFNLVDGAPDPIRFIKKERSYLNFLSKVESNETAIMKLIANKVHENFQRFLDSLLPIKRPHEFVILNYLMQNESVTLDQAKFEVERYLKHVELETLKHAFEHINGDFFDSREKNSFPKLAVLKHKDNTLILERSPELTRLVADKDQQHWLMQTLEYGLESYLKDFGPEDYGIPSLKHYQQYNMRDIAVIANVRKAHSSYRGTGVLRQEQDFFFFVDLHKDEKAISYNDKFISPDQFQWDSPNTSHPSSGQGYDIANHKAGGFRLHLFIRKFKKLDGVTEPYIYIGQGDVTSFEGKKPICFQLKLHHTVPQAIYDEFTTDTALDSNK